MRGPKKANGRVRKRQENFPVHIYYSSSKYYSVDVNFAKGKDLYCSLNIKVVFLYQLKSQKTLGVSQTKGATSYITGQ